MSPRAIFEYELVILQQSVTEMAVRVEDAYDSLFKALDEKNKNQVMNSCICDRIVKDMERGIEARCLSLITRQQPIARDLRMVSAALKVVTDIERIGNHISDMAELFLRLELPDLSQFSKLMPAMIKATGKIVQEAANAFVNRQMQEAQAVIEYDDVIDDYFNQVKKDLIVLLREDGKTPDDCIDVLMITKYLEKIGDHAVNIAEWEIFQETGNMQDVRVL